nr:probable prolyl 4-hydroxylase 4 [Tanacetum cinerariifolium]
MNNLYLLVLISLLFIVPRSSCSSIINPSKVKQVSWKPRAFVYEGFLTEEECDNLVSL